MIPPRTQPFKLNFCPNSKAHPDCLVQTNPIKVKGLKPRHKVVKVLQKYCKKSGMETTDEEIRKHELLVCCCSEGKKNGGESKALDLNKRIKSYGLKEGDSLFVRKVDKMEQVDGESGEWKKGGGSKQEELKGYTNASGRQTLTAEWKL